MLTPGSVSVGLNCRTPFSWCWKVGKVRLEKIPCVCVRKKKKTTHQLKNGQRIWIDISSKKIYEWPISTWKGARHILLGKCKWRPQIDTTLHLLGGGHGNPPQYSCPENAMNRRALWATVHDITKSWTQLKRLSMHATLTRISYHQKGS